MASDFLLILVIITDHTNFCRHLKMKTNDYKNMMKMFRVECMSDNRAG